MKRWEGGRVRREQSRGGERRGVILTFQDPLDITRIHKNTSFRLVRRDIAKIIREENSETVSLYFCLNNSIHFQEKPPQYLEVDLVFLEALGNIFDAYPKFLKVADLPLPVFPDESEEEEEEEDYNLGLVKALAQAGLLEIKS
jgi:hypothetical protein